MNAKPSLRIAFGVLLIFIVSLESCEEAKDAILSAEEEISVAQKSTVTDNMADEETLFYEESTSISGEGGRRREDECVVVTRDSTLKKVTLDFGEGCVGPYGRERSGKVFIQYAASFDSRTSSREVTFDNYFVNNKKVEGLVKLSASTRNSSNNFTQTRELVDFKVTFPNGESFTLNGSTVRELIQGGGDLSIGNEVFKITGSYEGTSSLGREYSRVITEPIVTDFSCRQGGKFVRVSGKQEITITGSKTSRTRIINYGDGECDSEIVITINDRDYTITIPEI